MVKIMKNVLNLDESSISTLLEDTIASPWIYPAVAEKTHKTVLYQ